MPRTLMRPLCGTEPILLPPMIFARVYRIRPRCHHLRKHTLLLGYRVS
jgi:hypothetical protein